MVNDDSKPIEELLDARDFTRQVGRNLHDVRLAVGLQDKEVARRMNLTKPQLLSIEEGRVPVDFRTLYAFSMLYGTPVNDFAVGCGKSPGENRG